LLFPDILSETSEGPDNCRTKTSAGFLPLQLPEMGVENATPAPGNETVQERRSQHLMNGISAIETADSAPVRAATKKLEHLLPIAQDGGNANPVP
jgi:hypothetical protein